MLGRCSESTAPTDDLQVGSVHPEIVLGDVTACLSDDSVVLSPGQINPSRTTLVRASELPDDTEPKTKKTMAVSKTDHGFSGVQNLPEPDQTEHRQVMECGREDLNLHDLAAIRPST